MLATEFPIHELDQTSYSAWDLAFDRYNFEALQVIAVWEGAITVDN